jgi:hypothetical protein
MPRLNDEYIKKIDDEDVRRPERTRSYNYDYDDDEREIYKKRREVEKQLDPKIEAEIERNKWRGRRRMAAISLASMIILMTLLLFAPIAESRIKLLEEPVTWFFFSMASVIGAYMGFTTWASKKGKG